MARFREHLPTGQDFRRVRHRWHRVLVLATATGVLVGLAVAAFEAVVGELLLEWTLDLPPVGQAVAPAVGLVGAWLVLRTIGRGATPAVADEYLAAYHERDGDIALDQAPGKTVAAGSTLGFGGAMGFEGPAIYLGATIGSAVRRRFPRYFETADRRLLLVAGAAAGVSAIFKAPATGAVFALEAPYRDDSASHTAVPAIVAAAASYLTFVLFFGLGRLFPVGGETPPLDARDLLGALLMGVLAGVGARGFAWVLRRAKGVARTGPVWLRLGCTGAGLALLAAVTTLVYDAPLSLGPGYGAVDWARDPSRAFGLVVLLLAIRTLATTLTLAGGGVGGVFIPLFVEGWLLGAAVEVLLGSDTLLFPVIGAAAFLGAGYRTPIAAVVFVAESTGRPGFIVPALVATAVAQLAMGGKSVTEYQLDRRLDRLERRGAMPIGDALAPVVQRDAHARVADLARDRAVAAATAVAVVDGGRFVGILDRRRVGVLLASGEGDTHAAEVLAPSPVVADPAWTVAEATAPLGSGAVEAVPVVDDGRCLGVVTAESILALDRRLR